MFDLLFFDAQIEDESVGWLKDQSLFLAAPFLTRAQKRESGVVSLDLILGWSGNGNGVSAVRATSIYLMVLSVSHMIKYN